MNKNSINAIILITVGLLLGFWVMISALTSGANAVGQLFRLLPVFFAICGFLAPKQSVYLLFLCAAYIGYFKKLLVLDGRYSFTLQYMVVGAPAILLLAMCMGTVVRLAFSPSSQKSDWKKVITFSCLSILVMIFIYFKSGALALAVMAGAYSNAAWVVALNFKKTADLRKLHWFVVGIFLFSSLVGFRQWIFGLSYLDLQYLELGYELATVDLMNPRPFATYGTSGHFGYAMLFATMLVLSLGIRSRYNPKPKKFLVYFLLLVGVAAVCCSLKKAPIISMLIFPIAVLCARNAKIASMAFLAMIFTVTATILYGDEISKWAREASEVTTKIHPTMSLNTINTRIESFQNIGAGEGAIALIGPGDIDAHSHTAITDILLIVGYIPTIALVILSVIGFFIAQRKLGKILGGWKSPSGREVSIYLGFFLSFIAGSLMGTNAFQAFPGSLVMWVVFGYVYIVSMRSLEETKMASDSLVAKGRPTIVGSRNPQIYGQATVSSSFTR